MKIGIWAVVVTGLLWGLSPSTEAGTSGYAGTRPASKPRVVYVQDLPVAKLVPDPNIDRVYFYSPYAGNEALLYAPLSQCGKVGICPVTGKNFVIPYPQITAFYEE